MRSVIQPKSKAHFRFFNEEYLNDEKKLYYTVDYYFIVYNNLWSYYHKQAFMVDSIKKEIQKSHYILCPLYGDLKGDTFTDLQFGVTETYKPDEKDIDAFDRSLGEELGLYTENKPKYIVYERNFKLNKINILDTKFIEKAKHIEKDEKHPENIKMATIVHGSEKYICNYLNKKEIVLDKSPDNIVGIVAVKLEDAIGYFNPRWKSIKHIKPHNKRRHYF